MEKFEIEFDVDEKIWKFAAIWSVLSSVVGAVVTVAVIGAIGYYFLGEDRADSLPYLMFLIYAAILYFELTPIYHRYNKRRPKVSLDSNSIYIYAGDVCTVIKYTEISSVQVSRNFLLVKTMEIKSKNDNSIEIIGVVNLSEIEIELNDRIGCKQLANI